MRLVSLATMLCVRDVERSTGWYRDKLGFEVLESDADMALLRLGSGLVYLFAESTPTEDNRQCISCRSLTQPTARSSSC